MELRDKNGLTEREYLAQSRADKYPRPSVTVDVCIFSRAADGALRTLLIRGGGHRFLGWGALAGGFARAKLLNAIAPPAATMAFAAVMFAAGIRMIF